MIVVVDCGSGNLSSVARALRRTGAEASISAEAAEIERADKLILPGVGSFAHGMTVLRERGLIPVLRRKVLEQGTPLLGICLGFQLLTRGSEEGQVPGLGWLAAETRRIVPVNAHAPVKIPHLGWNTLEARQGCPLLRDVPVAACMYFAHSYCVHSDDRDAVAAFTEYGQRFVSVAQRGHIFGTQFHPEKSQANGLRVLSNFAAFPG